MRGKTVSAVVVAGIVLFLGNLALAQDAAPAATVKFTEESVGVGVGFTRGHGVLTYRGQDYPFTATGLSVGEVGVMRAEARGTVHHLETLVDFNGSYTSAEAEATVAGGAGVTIMRNQNGVVIRLVSTTQGADLKLAAAGVTLRLAK
ncbi:MAG: DUF1134 domain-containing protein [Candidatus Rokuibacteriota bacterium]|nr:MAG: DUF1134 domain-containing protein [Candidatus Rokubacteria bacterium]